MVAAVEVAVTVTDGAGGSAEAIAATPTAVTAAASPMRDRRHIMLLILQMP